ncbi:hypothetical protein Halxa_0713 [Halopiger xanaduensis SH-6]|uniref:DUF7344 domain-containing protein n=2 Tax=Halopiger xanaduensis TaxID=387343 RepID=F8D6A6_HALXS|nr:hypothetical protein Halxa_0713 [Halopiger xanaduensis SH-6]
MVASDATPSLDLVFDLLSNRRRRYALYYLYEQPDGVATTGDLTDHVAELEMRTLEAEGDTESISEPEIEAESTPDSTVESGSESESASTASGDRRRQIRTELQHVHLPKLEDAGVLEHDPRSETVRYWTQPSLEEWLEHAYHKEL